VRLRIKSLELRNFATYREARLDFTSLRQPIVVIGDNGSGKTTFFVDGVTYALFKAAYGTEKARKLAKYNHVGRDPVATIDLVNEQGEVFRAINSEVYFVRSGMTPIQGIRELTGHTYKTLISTYIVRQGDISNFISLRPSEKRNYLISLLGYDFRRSREAVKDDIHGFELKLKGVEKDIESIETRFRELGFEEVSQDVLRERRDELEKMLKNLIKRYEELTRSRDELRSRLTNINRDLDRLRDVERKYREYNEYLKRMEDYLERLKGFGLVDVEVDSEYLRSLVDDQSTLSKLRDSIVSMKESIESLERHLKELKKMYEELDSIGDKEAIEEELSSIDKEIGYKEAEIDRFKEAIEALEKSRERCPVCGKELDEEHRMRLLDEYRRSIERLSSELTNLRELRNKYQKRLAHANRLLDMVSSKEREVSNIIARISTLYGVEDIEVVDYDSLPDTIRRILDSLVEGFREVAEGSPIGPYIRNGVDHIGVDNLDEVLKLFQEAVGEIGDIFSKLSSVKGSIEILEKEVRNYDLEFINRELDRLGSEKRSLEERVKELEKDIVESRAEAVEVEKAIEELDRLEDDVERYNELVREAENLKKDLMLLNLVYEVLQESGFPNYLVNYRIVRDLKESINRYLDTLGLDFTVDLVAGDKSIDLKVYSGGVVRDLRTLSGGEITILSLAMRLAIGEVISGFSMNYVFDFIILDEALPNLDEKNKDLVLDTLRRMVETGAVSQVILITHDRDIKDYIGMGSTVEVYKDETGSMLRVG